MHAEEIIKKGFGRMAKLYAEAMPSFYPTIESRGIDERNLVHLLLMAFKEESSAVTWLELPFIKPSEKKFMDRMDGAAYIQKDKVLIMIEAKRIKQGRTKGKLNSISALEQIHNDAIRLGDYERIQKMLKEMICTDAKERIYLYRVMIADIWMNKNNVNSEDPMEHPKRQWMSAEIFPDDWKAGCFLENKIKGCDGYRHLIAIAPVMEWPNIDI